MQHENTVNYSDAHPYERTLPNKPISYRDTISPPLAATRHSHADRFKPLYTEETVGISEMSPKLGRESHSAVRSPLGHRESTACKSHTREVSYLGLMYRFCMNLHMIQRRCTLPVAVTRLADVLREISNMTGTDRNRCKQTKEECIDQGERF